jgi:membrane protein required for beta-lactamase induction
MTQRAWLALSVFVAFGVVACVANVVLARREEERKRKDTLRHLAEKESERERHESEWPPVIVLVICGASLCALLARLPQ